LTGPLDVSLPLPPILSFHGFPAITGKLVSAGTVPAIWGGFLGQTRINFGV